ncbi:MAG: hypothetical protein IT159_08995 [Bryobacterales bacterium]|nr:hypothetical protein [Bryobacterales bacterium]
MGKSKVTRVLPGGLPAGLVISPLGIYPARLMLRSLPATLVEVVLAALPGAWVYREEAVA